MTTTPTPAVIARIDGGKDGGYLTRKAAEKYAAGFASDMADLGGRMEIDKQTRRDGRTIFVPVHVHVITPAAPAHKGCVQCEPGTPDNECGMQRYRAADAVRKYESVSALVATDPRYTFASEA